MDNDKTDDVAVKVVIIMEYLNKNPLNNAKTYF